MVDHQFWIHLIVVDAAHWTCRCNYNQHLSGFTVSFSCELRIFHMSCAWNESDRLLYFGIWIVDTLVSLYNIFSHEFLSVFLFLTFFSSFSWLPSFIPFVLHVRWFVSSSSFSRHNPDLIFSLTKHFTLTKYSEPSEWSKRKSYVKFLIFTYFNWLTNWFNGWAKINKYFTFQWFKIGLPIKMMDLKL